MASKYEKTTNLYDFPIESFTAAPAAWAAE